MDCHHCEGSICEKHYIRQLEAAQLSAARVLEEYRRIAFADIRSFFDEKGNLIPVKYWTEEQGSQMAGLEVIIKIAKAGDGHTDEVHKELFLGLAARGESRARPACWRPRATLHSA
jgi:hypothetical protein